MTSPEVKGHTPGEADLLDRARRCPICEKGLTHLVAPEVWQCERLTCNNEFFIDGEPGERLLNVRDKSLPSPYKRPPSIMDRISAAISRTGARMTPDRTTDAVRIARQLNEAQCEAIRLWDDRSDEDRLGRMLAILTNDDMRQIRALGLANKASLHKGITSVLTPLGIAVRAALNTTGGSHG